MFIDEKEQRRSKTTKKIKQVILYRSVFVLTSGLCKFILYVQIKEYTIDILLSIEFDLNLCFYIIIKIEIHLSF